MKQFTQGQVFKEVAFLPDLDPVPVYDHVLVSEKAAVSLPDKSFSRKLPAQCKLGQSSYSPPPPPVFLLFWSSS